MLLLALSCLQGRPMRAAFDALAAHGAGVQLTPGNHPTPGFEGHVTRAAAPRRSHHGFAFDARRREVWADDGTCLVDADSVHPPRTSTAAAEAIGRRGLGRWLEERPASSPLLETMYPGWLLGTGPELETAMDVGVPLALDVSHVFIQLTSGAMKEATWRRLAAYEHVREVHVSANDGTRDAHEPIAPGSFGVGWARERLGAGAPVVLECYMHRLSTRERQTQIESILGGTR